jgi:hypothetical protein
MRSNPAPTLFFILFSALSPCWAGLVIESLQQPVSGEALSSKITLDHAGLRSESGTDLFIFRPDKNLIWIVDAGRKEYRQMTESDLNQMTTKVGAAMQQMKEQLAQLPPEQRAMMEEMMKHQMPPGITSAESPKKEGSIFEKTAQGEKVGTWICEKYVEKENGIKIGEIWTVPSSSFVSFGKYFQVLEKLAGFFNHLPMAQQQAFEFPILKASAEEGKSGLSGIPVKDIRYTAQGTISNVWEMKKITEQSVEPALFELPPGYQLLPLMGEAP